jgi:hypothetical protein
MTIGCILFDGKKDTTLSISNRKDKSIVLTYVKGHLSIMDSSHIYYFDMNKWKLENDTTVVGCIKKTTKKHHIGNGHSLIKLKVHNNEYKKLIDLLFKYH